MDLRTDAEILAEIMFVPPFKVCRRQSAARQGQQRTGGVSPATGRTSTPKRPLAGGAADTTDRAAAKRRHSAQLHGLTLAPALPFAAFERGGHDSIFPFASPPPARRTNAETKKGYIKTTVSFHFLQDLHRMAHICTAKSYMRRSKRHHFLHISF